MTKKFHVTLLEHDEGVSVSCPERPGCHSQGATIAEAMENIHDAIEGYLDSTASRTCAAKSARWK